MNFHFVFFDRGNFSQIPEWFIRCEVREYDQFSYKRSFLLFALYGDLQASGEGEASGEVSFSGSMNSSRLPNG